MQIPKVGEPARPFRLPSAQGGDIGLDDLKGRQAVVLWFTKGMACPFCRTQMSQLARGYKQIKDRGAEVLEVTITTLGRATAYARQFPLPFPYLCDPERRVRQEWGLEKRSRSLGWYARNFVAGMKSEPPPSDFGAFKPPMAEVPGLLADDDMGFFIIDRGGTVRYALAGPYLHETGVRGVPGVDEILRELDGCATST